MIIRAGRFVTRAFARVRIFVCFSRFADSRVANLSPDVAFLLGSCITVHAHFTPACGSSVSRRYFVYHISPAMRSLSNTADYYYDLESFNVFLFLSFTKSLLVKLDILHDQQRYFGSRIRFDPIACLSSLRNGSPLSHPAKLRIVIAGNVIPSNLLAPVVRDFSPKKNYNRH